MGPELSFQLAGERMNEATPIANDTAPPAVPPASDGSPTTRDHRPDGRHDQSPRPRPAARWLTFTLAVIGALSLLKVRWDSVLHEVYWLLPLETGLYVMASLILGLLSERMRSPSWRRGWVSGFLIAPVISFFLLRVWNLGEATEILLMQICQNVALAAFAVGRDRRSEQMSVLFSFFLVFFVTALAESAQVFVFTVPYVILGIWWLMVHHWSRLETHMPSRIESHFRIRSLSFVTTATLTLLLVVLIGWKHDRILQTINGFMPTSGGSRMADRFARGGVGDGDFYVAARQQASTVGPVESELFLESSKPSLFDIIEENYNRPALPLKKKSERAFSPDDVTLKRSEEKIIQSEQSGRTFRTLRNSPAGPQQLTETRSNALFYLVGPTPIRLAMGYFDRFDGLDWTVSPKVAALPQRQLMGIEIDDRYWIQFHEPKKPVSRDMQGSAPPVHPYFQGMENHSIKVMRLSSNRILTPSSVAGWHFDKCDSTSFFGWTRDGAIEFKGRESLPELAVYHLISRGVNYRKLAASSEIVLRRSKSAYNEVLEFADREALSRLAAEITRDANTDWQKVDLVVEHLRRHFQLQSTLGSQSDDPAEQTPVGRFLKDGGGPDYLFATAAAMMLRTLGIETRLVNGFYVGPDDFDAYSGQSLVHAENFHFWVEVRVDGRDWITIEPSPGYEPPREKMTWTQRMSSLASTVIAWFMDRPVLTAGGVLLLVVGWLLRAWIGGALLWAGWLVEGCGSTRRRALATFRLIQRRSRFLGAANGRGSVEACCDFYASRLNGSRAEEQRRDLANLARAVNQLLYCSQPRLIEPRELDRSCWSIAGRGWPGMAGGKVVVGEKLISTSTKPE